MALLDIKLLPLLRSILVFFCLLPSIVQAAFTITPLDISPPTILTTALLGAGIVVSNVTYTGAVTAAGTFTGGATIIGFDSGIILSTGNAMSVLGPVSGTNSTSTSWTLAGDASLEAMAGVSAGSTHDASVLQFDFVPTTNYISFTYVFASDEYNDYVGSFNDVFAFFVNGTNVALVPGSASFVSIDNVNACVNSAYYINNEPGYALTCPAPVANVDTIMHGLTTVLVAGSTVNPGVTNHVKIAIADMTDFALDSNVFIEANSFTVSTPLPTPTPSPTRTQTFTPTPTYTQTSTVTPTPSNTSTSTNTPTVTNTQTVTNTPTITNTLTSTSTPTLSATFTNTYTPTLTYTPTCVTHVWPDPYNPDTAVRRTLKFDCLQTMNNVNIYTISGEQIKNMPVTAIQMEWNGRNTQGYPVATGVYCYVVEKSGKAASSGKFLLISGH